MANPFAEWGTPAFLRKPVRTRGHVVPMKNLWMSDWGEIELPEDFPVHIFRKDGWWDMRYTAIRERWEAWVEAETAKLRSGYQEA